MTNFGRCSLLTGNFIMCRNNYLIVCVISNFPFINVNTICTTTLTVASLLPCLSFKTLCFRYWTLSPPSDGAYSVEPNRLRYHLFQDGDWTLSPPSDGAYSVEPNRLRYHLFQDGDWTLSPPSDGAYSVEPSRLRYHLFQDGDWTLSPESFILDKSWIAG
jgi:glycyl-tRNA synthetase alpha subunit